MRKLHAAAVAAIIALAPTAVLAQAQTLNPGAQDESQRSIEFNDNNNQLPLTGMRDSDFTTALDVLSDPQGVSFVEVGANSTFEAPDIEGLQQAVMASPEAMRALRAAGIDPTDVVGIEAGGNGGVTLYISRG